MDPFIYLEHKSLLGILHVPGTILSMEEPRANQRCCEAERKGAQPSLSQPLVSPDSLCSKLTEKPNYSLAPI